MDVGNVVVIVWGRDGTLQEMALLCLSYASHWLSGVYTR